MDLPCIEVATADEPHWVDRWGYLHKNPAGSRVPAEELPMAIPEIHKEAA
jgi:hypothetical protein